MRAIGRDRQGRNQAVGGLSTALPLARADGAGELPDAGAARMVPRSGLGTQVAGACTRNAVAKATGLGAGDDHRSITSISGGAFGRRLDIDMIEIAAGFAKQVILPGQADLDPRRGHAARFLPALLLRPGRGRAGCFGQDRRLDPPGHRLVGDGALGAGRAFKDGLDAGRGRMRGRRDALRGARRRSSIMSGPSPMAFSTGWWRGVGPTHNRVRGRKLRRRAGGGGQAGPGGLSPDHARQEPARAGGP